MSTGPLVIVGASYAGLQIAASAREHGFAEPIYLLGDEPHAPYQRPALSKGLLTGKTTEDQLPLRAPEFFAEHAIELMTGCRVEAIDVGRERVTLSGGHQIAFGRLALATGASCRPPCWPGADLGGVQQLRTLDEARAVAASAEQAERVCVIGGGYIGLEVAAALRTRGKAVTVIEQGARVLARSMPPAMSAYLERTHRQRGVDLRTGQDVRALRGEAGRVAGVELDDGTVLACELVVLGIGVVPNAQLARAAGLAVSNGIETDACGRTSAPHVVAAGDVACVMNPAWPGAVSPMRLESIQAANDGARAAAATLAGRPQPCTAVPWFWSDQFDLKLQMAGVALPGDRVVVRGDMESDRFSVAYLRDGVLAAMHSVNRPAEHMLARKLVAAGARLHEAEAADAQFDLRQVLARTAEARDERDATRTCAMFTSSP